MVFKFFNTKFIILDGMGFESITDYIQNVFVNKGLLISSGIITAVVCSIDHFVNASIFSPSKGIYILFGATFFDVLLGISVAVANKKKDGTSHFDAYKLGRAWMRLATQIGFIFLLFQISHVWPLVSSWMVSTLLLAFVMATFWSAFKNAYKLKWIQPSTYEWLEKILSIQEIFNTVVKKMFKPEKPKD